MTETFDQYLERKRRQYPNFDPSDLDLRFAPYLHTNKRIRVDDHGTIRTGTVGVTCGWRPVFILMRASNHIGSSVTLTHMTVLL